MGGRVLHGLAQVSTARLYEPASCTRSTANVPLVRRLRGLLPVSRVD